MGVIKDMLRAMQNPNPPKEHSYLKHAVAGSMYRMSDMKSQTDVSDIRTIIRTMRALAEDSQVATALAYYATDATTTNTDGQIIWATDKNENTKCSDLINALFKRWKINKYARDHILELATVGNLYIPTTDINLDQPEGSLYSRMYIGLDRNEIPKEDYDIIPSHMIDPEDIVHIWHDYTPFGYIYDPENNIGSSSTMYSRDVDMLLLPESSVIHFSLGGMIGKYSIQAKDESGNDVEYDIQFAKPLMSSAVQPTQTLNLLEDATVLSSLIKVVRFVGIDCKDAEEEEEESSLLHIKQLIEQQMSLNTSSGDAQSFINPQSPNNLIYVPKVNGNMPIEILDLNMRDDSEGNDKLLDYYQDKKLSVLGIPKEAMNFSSSEGLGGAGAVMSQRSALYANSLQRIETAYIEGWTDAINKYFENRNLYQYVNQFELHMQPILTEMSTVQFEKRDSAISQASSMVDLMVNSLNMDNKDEVLSVLSEILTDALPSTSSKVNSWDVDISNSSESSEGGF